MVAVVLTVGSQAMMGLGAYGDPQTGQVMIDVSECIRLDAPDARLACYEARVAALFRAATGFLGEAAGPGRMLFE